MNINASNQSLINTLLQQASKSSEKKRPTFEQVFAKLNARSARMDANKNPINNMLTNEQLFRYYIKETEPKLQISNEIFSGEELFNFQRNFLAPFTVLTGYVVVMVGIMKKPKD